MEKSTPTVREGYDRSGFRPQAKWLDSRPQSSSAVNGGPGKVPEDRSGLTEAAFDIADQLLNAIQDNDVGALRRLYAPDIRFWRNTQPEVLTGEAAVQATAGPRAAAASIRFDVTRRQSTDRGFVQQETVHIQFNAGGTASVPIVVIADIVDGRIVRLDEYMDSAAIGNLL